MNMRNVCLVALAFLGLTRPAFAVAEIRRGVVKVFSGPCDEPGVRLRGSGFFLEHAGKTYVVTSEHVVAHSNRGYCHEVWHPTLGTVASTLVAAEYGNGLAVLYPEKEIPRELRFELGDTARGGARVYVLGFPWDSSRSADGNAGTVTFVESDGIPLPLLPFAHLLSGAFGAYGMSGGPVVDEKGKVVAVLSHQFLRLVPGSNSVIATFGPDQKMVENQLLGIPSQAVLSWLKEIAAQGTSYIPFFVRDPVAQVKGQEVIYSGRLRFECAGTNKDAPVGGGAHGVGGGAHGVGGKPGDGAAAASSVRVSLAPEWVESRWGVTRLRSWYERSLAAASIPWKAIRVNLVVRRQAAVSERVRFDSLSDFFRLIAKPDHFPVSELADGPPSSQNPASAVALAGKALASSVASLQRLKIDDEAVKRLLSQLALLAGIAQGEEWAILSSHELEALGSMTRYQQAWKKLTSEQFDATVELLARIRHLHDALAAHRID